MRWRSPGVIEYLRVWTSTDGPRVPIEPAPTLCVDFSVPRMISISCAKELEVASVRRVQNAAATGSLELGMAHCITGGRLGSVELHAVADAPQRLDPVGCALGPAELALQAR